MANKEVCEIIRWAAQLANKYDIGINTIVDAYVKANKELCNSDAAKNFIENEMSSLRRKSDD